MIMEKRCIQMVFSFLSVIKSYFLFALRDILIQALVTIIQIRAQYIPLFLPESICLIVILEHQSEYFGYSLQPQCFFSFSEK